MLAIQQQSQKSKREDSEATEKMKQLAGRERRAIEKSSDKTWVQGKEIRQNGKGVNVTQNEPIGLPKN
jgi:hypothetical protein